MQTRTVQQVLKNVPNDRVDEIVGDFKSERAEVYREPQADGTWLVTAAATERIDTLVDSQRNALIEIAQALARERQHDVVSRVDIERAHQLSQHRGSERHARLTWLAGVMLGVGCSSFMTAVLGDVTFSPARIVASIAPIAVGALLLLFERTEVLAPWHRSRE